MASHANIASAAAAASAANTSSNSKKSVLHSRLHSPGISVAEARQMKEFEAEYMQQLTRRSLSRFAKSGTVPAADTRDSILEACNTAAASLNRQNEEEVDYDDDETPLAAPPPPRGEEHQQPRPHNNRSTSLGLTDELLNDAEKKRFRQQEHNVWLFSCPSRLRKFFNLQQTDRSIFCDVVVRLPIVGAGKEEVLSLCRVFGDCEYQGPCYSASSSPSASSPARRFSHIVSFANGADAIKFFVETNGYYIDPNSCQKTLEGIVSRAVRASSSSSSTSSSDDQKKLVEQIPKFLSDLHVKSGESFDENEDADVLSCWSSKLVFVTCDFFRAAFFDKQRLAANDEAAFVPRAEMSTRSCYEMEPRNDAESAAAESTSFVPARFFFGKSPTKKKQSLSSSSSSTRSIPDSWNPAEIICRRLVQRAKELIRIFPLVASHSPEIEWVGMCRAANCVAFFVPIPHPAADAAPADASSTSSPALSELERKQHQVWFITLRALRQCKVNVVALFRAIDGAACTDDLFEGGKLFSLRSTPLEPPTPSKSRSSAKEESGGENAATLNVAVLPSVRQMLGGFFSPDPGQREINKIFELGAFVILAIIIVWALVVGHSMVTHPKPRYTGRVKEPGEIGDL